MLIFTRPGSTPQPARFVRIDIRARWTTTARSGRGGAHLRRPAPALNLFFITGPGSPSLLSTCRSRSNGAWEFVSRSSARCARRGAELVEPTAQADGDRPHVQKIWPALCSQDRHLVQGAGIPGKRRSSCPTLGRVGRYRQRDATRSPRTATRGFIAPEATHPGKGRHPFAPPQFSEAQAAVRPDTLRAAPAGRRCFSSPIGEHPKSRTVMTRGDSGGVMLSILRATQARSTPGR